MNDDQPEVNLINTNQLVNAVDRIYQLVNAVDRICMILEPMTNEQRLRVLRCVATLLEIPFP